MRRRSGSRCTRTASRPDEGSERHPTTAADDPWWAVTGSGVLVGMRMTVRVYLIAVAVVTGRDRIKVDPRFGDGRLGLGAVPLRVVAG
jgi:hypothetical protein